MYKHLENKMCKELEDLEEKYRTGMEMSEGDLRRIDLLVHSLKSLATYSAMKEAEESQRYESRMNNSYMNSYGQEPDNRYMSRDNMSGRYPMYPYQERRW